jgi:threonine synthase
MGSQEGGETGAPTVVLATAHPAKFREVVEPALGRQVPLPTVLAERLALPIVAGRIGPRLEALADLLTRPPQVKSTSS